MKVLTITILAVLVSLFGNSVKAGGCCPAKSTKKTSEKNTVKEQTSCPVMGGKINEKQYVDVKGKRIYVCCPGCITKIKKNPDEYIKKIEKSGVTLEQASKKEKSVNKTSKKGCH